MNTAQDASAAPRPSMQRQATIELEKTSKAARKFCGADPDIQLPNYDPNISVVSTLLSWNGTILPLTLKLPSYWLLVASHGLWIGLTHVKGLNKDDWTTSSYSVITVPGSLMVFFLVFYGSQCYARFFQMYSHTVGIAGTIMCWCALVKLHLGDDPVVRWNAVRGLIAAAHVEYYSLSGGELTPDEWAIIQGRDLLCARECEEIKKFKGVRRSHSQPTPPNPPCRDRFGPRRPQFKPFLPITWGLVEVRAELMRQIERETLKHDHEKSEGAAAFVSPVFVSFEWDEFTKIAFELRGHCSQIVNLLKQPVPWAYFHLLNMMCFLTLFLVGYVLIDLAPPYVTFCVHAVVCLIFMGMKNLAVAMADPFGDDVIDFKLEKFLAAMYDNALASLHAHYEPCGNSMPEGINCPLPTHRGHAISTAPMASISTALQKQGRSPSGRNLTSPGDLQTDDKGKSSRFAVRKSPSKAAVLRREPEGNGDAGKATELTVDVASVEVVDVMRTASFQESPKL